MKIIIYDAVGKMIDELINYELDAGTYSTDWNGAGFSSGMYFYKIEAGSFVQTKKMVLIK